MGGSIAHTSFMTVIEFEKLNMFCMFLEEFDYSAQIYSQTISLTTAKNMYLGFRNIFYDGLFTAFLM